jgi:hypothetical protein
MSKLAAFYQKSHTDAALKPEAAESPGDCLTVLMRRTLGACRTCEFLLHKGAKIPDKLAPLGVCKVGFCDLSQNPLYGWAKARQTPGVKPDVSVLSRHGPVCTEEN